MNAELQNRVLLTYERELLDKHLRASKNCSPKNNSCIHMQGFVIGVCPLD